LELKPDFVKAWTKKGNCHFALKEYHKAIDAFEKTLKFEPENIEAK